MIKADNIIFILIGLNIYLRIMGLFKHIVIFLGIAVAYEYAPKGLLVLLVILSLTFFLFFGIANILLGLRLLKLNDDLFGMLKPLAYMSIVCGVCLASVLLSPFGMLAAVAKFIIQGIIFLRSSEEAEFV